MPTIGKSKRRRIGSRADIVENSDPSSELLSRLAEVFSEPAIDELRRQTGYNPRKRVATAFRLLYCCVEASLCGKTLGFATIRAFFLKRFGNIRPRAFQLRFKSSEAVAFFRGALGLIVESITKEFSPSLTKHLSGFDDVMLYDGTGQRAPKRARTNGLKATSPDSAGSKWVIGYSLRNGIAIEAIPGSGTSAEIPMWKELVPQMRENVLYLLDLGFYCRHVYEEAIAQNAHLLMRLKADTTNLRDKLRVIQAQENGRVAKLRNQYTFSSYLRRANRFAFQTIDLDVYWGMGESQMRLRVVGVRKNKRWHLYLTTLTQEQMSSDNVAETYRLRWLIEFLFREWKQQTDWGRSATADKNALEALTYAALISHALVRSIRIATALKHECGLDTIRPLACMHVVRAYASELISALLTRNLASWLRTTQRMLSTVFLLAYELRPSCSRPRIARNLGALGG